MHAQLVNKIVSDPSLYQIVTFERAKAAGY
jgi:hypothetical protein